MLKYLILLVLFVGCASSKPKSYPNHWWAKVEKKDAKWWEILPQSGEPGKTVILSKRNELGLLSNFAHTPFVFEEVKYESVEGLWQSMKFPESCCDERADWVKEWKNERHEVSQMIGFEAKKAGDYASKLMKKYKANWVTYAGERMEYRTSKKAAHYELIKKIMRAKLEQNPKVKKVLWATRGLKLLPDHHQKPDAPPAWKYYQIWEELREEL